MTKFEQGWLLIALLVLGLQTWLVTKKEPPIACPHYRELCVTVTSYRAVKEQTDDSPNWTSVGTPAIMGICAASRDLLETGLVQYGDLIEIPSLGIFKVMDTMNKRHTNHLDVLVYTKTQEKCVGWRKKVMVRRLFQ